MEWWAGQGRPLEELHADVIVAYARVQYKLLLESGSLESPTPRYLVDLLDTFAKSLPSQKHIQAFKSIRAEALFQLALPI